MLSLPLSAGRQSQPNLADTARPPFATLGGLACAPEGPASLRHQGKRRLSSRLALPKNSSVRLEPSLPPGSRYFRLAVSVSRDWLILFGALVDRHAHSDSLSLRSAIVDRTLSRREGALFSFVSAVLVSSGAPVPRLLCVGLQYIRNTTGVTTLWRIRGENRVMTKKNGVCNEPTKESVKVPHFVNLTHT